MTYKETLFFVGKCLTITHEEKSRIEVEQEIKSENFDWDSVVKLSTSHYVFPALYCNLKRANLLKYPPEELVNYMKHITDLNRDRNQQIIEQAKEVNQLLLENNITPIFLKGTGNLLEGLYEDIAERMVGDIDFIFSESDYRKAIVILEKNGYSKVLKTNNDFPATKHYPRLKKNNYIAAVEIHKELLIEKYTNEFNYSFVKKDAQSIEGITVMSFKNQLCLSILAKQVNDDGFYFKDIALRNAYDVFLLSKRTNAKEAIKNFKALYNPLNSFLALSFYVLNQPDSISYTSTGQIKNYLSTFHKIIENSSFRKRHYKKWKFIVHLKSRFTIIGKAFYKKEYTIWLFKRLFNNKTVKQSS